jgi:hypothetical protein
VTELLKMAHLPNQHGVTEMEVGAVGSKPALTLKGRGVA